MKNLVLFPIGSLNIWCVVLFQYFNLSHGFKIIDNFVNNELYLGLSMYQNTTIQDCIWHKTYDECSEDVSIILYVENNIEVYDSSDKNWLEKSSWDPNKESVVVIHGYAAGDADIPVTVLRNAYLTHGGYNFFFIDYGKLARPPCYVSTVNNVPYISRCTARFLNHLRRSGLVVRTCIGHSLGAIICGLLKDYLHFQLNKIIALDPALPLIFGRLRLSQRSARFVHVLQTNAGRFGDVGSVGHVNVCVNGGLIQPYCQQTSNPNLCSHIWSLCYMSQSLFEHLPLVARKCSTYCPNAGIFKFFRSNSSENNFNEIEVINNVPLMTTGTYCLDNIYPPYCPKYLNGFGDERCCQFM